MQGIKWLRIGGWAMVVAFLPVVPTRGEEDPFAEDVTQLVEDLSHAEYARRERASRQLRTMGLPALPLVLEAALGDDPEAAGRGTKLLIFYADSFDEQVVPLAEELLNKRALEGAQSTGASRVKKVLDLISGGRARDRSAAHFSRLGVPIEVGSERVLSLTLGTQWTGSDHDLRHLERFPELTTLDLSKTKVGDAALGVLSRLPNLEKLYVGATTIGGAGLAQLKSVSNLKYLSLEGLKIGAEGAEHIAALTTLEHLGFDYTKVSDAGLRHVAGLKGLQTLWLNGAPVEGPGLDHLKELPRLNKLVLAKSSFTDKGMPFLGRLTGLEHLGLEGTKITDAQITQLEKLVNLKRLWLNGTAISDQAIPSLAKLQSLEKLAIPECKFSEEGISRLRELLPACEILTEQ